MKRLFIYILSAVFLLSPLGDSIVLASEKKFSKPEYVNPVEVNIGSVSSGKSLVLSSYYSIAEKNNILLEKGIYSIEKKNGKFILSKNNKKIFEGETVTLFPVHYSLNSTIKVDGNEFLGEMKFQNTGIFNTLPVDHYLYGVLPYEMNENWPLEALKAQSVAARNYALKKNGILNNSVSDQVYKGFNPNHKNSVKAVDETRGITMTDSAGRLIDTFFSSSNGGYQLAPKNVWARGTNLSYLPKQEDPFDYEITPHKWSFSFQKEQITELVSSSNWNQETESDINTPFIKALKEKIKKDLQLSNDIKIKSIDNITFTHAKDANSTTLFIGKMDVKFFEKNNNVILEKTYYFEEETYQIYLQKMLGVNNEGRSIILSPNVTKVSLEDGRYTIEGAGYGHSIGMSQYGAKARAEAGHTFKEILSFYFNSPTFTSPIKSEVFKNNNTWPIENIDDNNDNNNDDKDKNNANDENISGEYYVVKKGDTLWSISQRTGISVEEIKKLNGLKNNTIYVGQKLILKAKNDQKGNNSNSYQTYKVKKGDTLWAISRKYNMTVDQLMEINNLKTTVISIGQTLKVTSKSDNNNKNNESKTPESPKKPSKETTYTVKRGDTLWSISRKYNVSLNQLMNMNKLKDTKIYIGQKLVVSKESSSSSTNKGKYVVKPGDTLWGISQKTKVSVEQLMKKNNLTSSLIRIGQILVY